MNKFGKSIDKTFLSIDQAEARGFIHRDYIAHCFRWSHVIKQLSRGQKYKTARILDIGCGRLMPMGTMLHSSRMAPAYYCGVEYGPVDRHNPSVATTLNSEAFNCDIWENTDIRKFKMDEGEELFDVIVCFEMLEHVEPSMVLETLQKIREVSKPDAVCFISTPCFNGDAAANHVNEMTYDALRAVFIQEGFVIEDVHGTFASISDYQMDMTPAEKDIFMRLRDYYDVNVLSNIFAPMHPEHSRNCLWEISPTGKCQILEDAEFGKQPWSSSTLWKELDRGQK